MERFLTRRSTIDKLRTGPLGSHLDEMAEYFCVAGYCPEHVRFQLRFAAEFGRWLERRKLPLGEMRAERFAAFLLDRARRRGALSAGALCFKVLREVFRRKGLIVVEPPVDRTPCRRRVEGFKAYLRQERRLAAVTVIRYASVVEGWLRDRFGDGPVELSFLSPADVVAYVRRRSSTIGRKTAKLLVGALRSFLRYAHYRGYIRRDLAIGIPPIADWSKTSIPRGISQRHIRQVLASCDRRRAGGRRDYAILLLFARLGLRVSEVISLTLEDIDWEQGILNVRGKGSSGQLPLPADAGEAIAAYLKRGRRPSQSRLVFLGNRAPATGLKAPAGCAIVARALKRAGIDSDRKGTHQFRHALATQMLRRGASLHEIGELLRHRNVQTTTIYAKVDLRALRALAQPWPGAADERVA